MRLKNVHPGARGFSDMDLLNTHALHPRMTFVLDELGLRQCSVSVSASKLLPEQLKQLIPLVSLNSKTTKITKSRNMFVDL
jgi:hypothetical protein